MVVLFHCSSCEQNDVLVGRKNDLCSTLRYVDAILEHVCVLIYAVAEFRVSVCTYVSNLGILQISCCLTFMAPLSQESAIERNIDGLLALAYGECGIAVACGRSCEHINLVILIACRQLDCVAVACKSVVCVHLTECEVYSVNCQSVLRQELGSIAVATLEVGSGAEFVE